jgi:hypothetical protein
MLLLLWLALQGPAPTVGDTIWLERRISVPAGTEVRAPGWVPPDQLELLGKPVLRTEGGEVVVAYPATAWRPGSYQVEVPGPILIAPDGRTDSLPPERQTVQVASVLPPGSDPRTLEIQPAAGILARYVTSPYPVFGSLGVAALLFGALFWAWRRRGDPLMPVAPAGAAAVPAIGAWVEAGELRAVAASAAREVRAVVARQIPAAQPGLDTDRLSRVLAEQRPGWPVAAVARILSELEQTAFAEGEPEDLPELLERARALIRELEQGPP